MKSKLEKLQEKLVRVIARCSVEYGVLKPGDRILVALSGGKDSYCLLYLLQKLIPRLPFEIELVAGHVTQGLPGVDMSPFLSWLESCGVSYDIARENTFEVVQRNMKDGENPCSICARMRRGVLYTRAEKLGCNKIALGHHRDDSIATLLMNLFYSGRIQAMPPSYTTDDGRFEVVRPMIELAEKDLIELTRLVNFPIVTCSMCVGMDEHRRKTVGRLVDSLETEHPDVRNVMLAAMKNVRPTHLLDPDLTRLKK